MNDYVCVCVFWEKYKKEVTGSDEVKLHPERYDSYEKKCR